MRKPAGRARIAEALTTYAEEAAKNTIGGRLYEDDIAPADVLRTAAGKREERPNASPPVQPEPWRYQPESFKVAAPTATFAPYGEFGDRTVSAQMHAPEISEALGADVPGTIVRPFGGPLTPDAPTGSAANPNGLVGYHGSPHDFDRFDISKIGTGEGAQAFGRGLYFAENRGIADAYRRQLSGGAMPSEEVLRRYWKPGETIGSDKVVAYHGNGEVEVIGTSGFHSLRSRIHSTIPSDAQINSVFKARGENGYTSPSGYLYKVRISRPPEHFVDWDKSFKEQSDYVKAAFDRAGLSPDDPRTARVVAAIQANPAFDGRADVSNLKLVLDAVTQHYPKLSENAASKIANDVMGCLSSGPINSLAGGPVA